MVNQHCVKGYENFLKFMDNFKSNEPTFVLYTGSKLQNGNSWCPDCVEVEPFIKKSFQVAPENYLLITVEVGDRPFWKDQKCPFRTNSKTQVKVLPTLVRWGTQKRLEGDQLLNIELIEMLLRDDD